MTKSTKKAPDVIAAASHFPYWPYAWMAYAEHLGRDYEKHLTQLARAVNGADAVNIEGAYDAHLAADMSKAFYNLVLSPWSAACAMVASRSDAPMIDMD